MFTFSTCTTAGNEVVHGPFPTREEAEAARAPYVIANRPVSDVEESHSNERSAEIEQ